MDYIYIKGDSQLFVSLLMGSYYPKHLEFFNSIKRVKLLVKNLPWPVHYFHVDRKFNEIAEFMGHLALDLGCNVDMTDLSEAMLAKFAADPCKGMYMDIQCNMEPEDFDRAPCHVCGHS